MHAHPRVFSQIFELEDDKFEKIDEREVGEEFFEPKNFVKLKLGHRGFEKIARNLD